MSDRYRYIIFYKPYGVLSQFSSDNSQCLTLKNYIDVPNVYPVGRLDSDSEGLILLTDWGKLQHRLSHPQFGHERTYWVQVERVPDVHALNQLQTGIKIKNFYTLPTKVKLLKEEPSLPPRNPPVRYRKNVPTAWLEITMTEGKNRQVRRMTAAVGFPTLRLIRVKITNLDLQGMQPGEWRDLTSEECNSLQKLTFSYPSLKTGA
ncbi:MAG: pseudouridine synthase [Mastigocoleus sp.]